MNICSQLGLSKILKTYVRMLIADTIVVAVYISLGALIPNSRDQHEKQWRPDFTHHKTHPKMQNGD